MKKLSAILIIALFTVSAFAADGDVDTSFGTNGIVTEGSPYTGFDTVVVQPDGKILAAGRIFVFTPVFANTTGIVRYNPNGTLDTSFGTGGKLTVEVMGGTIDFPTLVLQPDGKFIIVGRFSPTSGSTRIGLVRYNANGTIDTTFGTNGLTVSNFTDSGSRGDSQSDAVLQPDGKIVVSGSARGTAFCVSRWNANGTLDTGFGTTGGDTCLAGTPSGTGSTQSIALQADGKIVMSGRFTSSFNIPFDFIVFRFNPTGTLDTSFDGDGYVITDLNGGNDNALSVIVRPDGKILAIGSARAVNAPDTGFGLVQYNANGSLDAGFGAGGKAITTFAGGETFAEDFPAALQANGKVVVGRSRIRADNIGNESQIARFNLNGSLDTTFGAGGQIIFAPIQNVRDLVLQPDGKIVAVGVNQPGNSITARFLNTDSAPPVNNPAIRLADFDGDGRTDASVFRNGTWFINPSTAPSFAPNSFYGVQFGLATDKLAPADYDGDGKTDVAVWRESEQNFYILQSANNSVRVENFGLAGDVLTVGDYDGDGKADVSTYREGAQSYFFYRASANNPSGNITYLPWGTTGDKSVRGDFDGDGKLDAAVYRGTNQTWYIRNSSNGQISYTQFGLPTDKRISGDFDGDGKTDICVFRDGIWYILQSSNGQIRYQNWGISTDTIAAGDYDGDGKTDFAVWRDGIYYILNSGNSQVSYQNFGASGDKTVASAYIQ